MWKAQGNKQFGYQVDRLYDNIKINIAKQDGNIQTDKIYMYICGTDKRKVEEFCELEMNFCIT